MSTVFADFLHIRTKNRPTEVGRQEIQGVKSNPIGRGEE